MTPQAEAERDTGILTPTTMWEPGYTLQPSCQPSSHRRSWQLCLCPGCGENTWVALQLVKAKLCLHFATNGRFVLLQVCACPPPHALSRTDKVTFLFSFKATDSEAFLADWQKTRHSPGSCKWKIHPPPRFPQKVWRKKIQESKNARFKLTFLLVYTILVQTNNQTEACWKS
ncbi:adrenocorticotropic hormone receptor [Platysternon megacephalum]|uniref:Adrenocorticotropic hormone receptor n=1 Tax=Platysternon megacephalum TaxID=55544 RepID=A0A4D9DPG9_9SAUR|nr:adrenocorticotropic hormone receptor [Platysternon megacephalum]